MANQCMPSHVSDDKPCNCSEFDRDRMEFLLSDPKLAHFLYQEDDGLLQRIEEWVKSFGWDFATIPASSVAGKLASNINYVTGGKEGEKRQILLPGHMHPISIKLGTNGESTVPGNTQLAPIWAASKGDHPNGAVLVITDYNKADAAHQNNIVKFVENRFWGTNDASHSLADNTKVIILCTPEPQLNQRAMNIFNVAEQEIANGLFPLDAD